MFETADTYITLGRYLSSLPFFKARSGLGACSAGMGPSSTRRRFEEADFTAPGAGSGWRPLET